MIASKHATRAPLLPDSARRRLVDDLRGQGVTDERVLAAIGRVPRHEFVSEGMRWRAYENTALPIGQAQTISQPLVVGLMTQTLIADAPRKRVLEVGTGCGYQAAVLAEIINSVFTIERIKVLSMQARETLRRLGYQNIIFQYGDGMSGWPGHSPYDGILVTAGAPEIPQALTAQLAAGGRLVMPLGGSGAQRLVVIDKQADGRLQRRDLSGVSFVPLVAGKA
ncbi:protein-L-isoaspartate(D-aspartate) O-methyltransferase [Algiphilus sp.]|uniref:protein-L-isoaspartate(D-aspartate) O-methyltransferase n=1 Tax=Algiphilus sp. TaxID=1872431 RepID=UPI0025C28CF6|nr:protein-L-isoaspartate(D-aspartate) O-methyltransferase [Algiphilus sp.]MCK5770868.1 protein-L-isoaspartate(D-aspartate) O-methyltransferase [Algiphilus sp.]